ncbi:MAG: uroporphyrinogen decarboxylase family protein [Planctomycetota bacterium]|nr:uroporphyrinogen decarboxylase family protein [Planctomycetota bacterium]
MAMTPRERWLALLNGEKPDRIPTDYWATEEVTKRLLKDLKCNDIEELYDKLHIDGVHLIDAKRTITHHPDDLEANIWGLRSEKVAHGTGSPLHPAEPEADGRPCPQPRHPHLLPHRRRCPGMEREGLVRDFGDKIGFHGAVDNQQTLPFGSVDDVRNEVLDNIRIFAPPARWICAPCHNIQAVSPTENIVAMYETIRENGKL